ncbi:peptidoglycan editing factor PgeF [Pseudomonadota bacterium]
MPEPLSWIEPDWPAPPHIRTIVTTRQGGVSLPPFDGLNLADHVGDDPKAVIQNRKLLCESLGLPAEPLWLTQVHGCNVLEAEACPAGGEADAVIAHTQGQVCAVLTADCLPLLLCDREGAQVAAIHAGWRGLAAGVIEAALKRFSAPGEEIVAWLGPAIGPQAFEVGDEVRDAFIKHDPSAANAFVVNRPGHWLADIYLLARQRLVACGVGFVGGGDCCTVFDEARFFSYRRDGKTGRMASLIWMEK